ncbi:hypothetical protein [Clostridioides sp. ZZV14-6045]
MLNRDNTGELLLNKLDRKIRDKRKDMKNKTGINNIQEFNIRR